LTKGELKRQRDALKSYERYLPTLQLKKQQLQLEILHLNAVLEDRRAKEKSRVAQRQVWAGLLTDKGVSLEAWLRPKEAVRGCVMSQASICPSLSALFLTLPNTTCS
jgi:V/A-type H+-transporting ATPase subunit D